MFDFDSEEIHKLFETKRDEWWEKSKAIADILGNRFYATLERVSGITRVAIKSIKVATRRGAHVIVKLAKEDWERLHGIIKANKELGEVSIPPVEGHVIAKGKLELRTLGVTPLSSYKHKIIALNQLHPFNLEKVNQVLKWLGLQEIRPPKLEFHKTIEEAQPHGHSAREVKRKEGMHTIDTNSTGNLSDTNVNKVVDILAPFWISRHRDKLELGLLGWFIKRGIKHETAREVIRRICERAGDEELEQRLREVDRHYILVKNGEKQVEELLGKSGLISELEVIIKQQNPTLTDEEIRDRALSVVSELEKVLGPRRSRIVRIPYRTGWFFVNDPQRGILLLKEKADENGQVKRAREYISDWYVAKGVVVRGDGQYTYRLLFVNARTKERWILAGQLDEIVRELRRVHGVRRSQVLYDAVSSVVEELIRRGIIKKRKTAAVAGILPMKGGIKLVRAGALSRLLIPKVPDIEKARQALELLKEIREHYDVDKFDIALNWGVYAPIGYALKKLYGIKQMYLMLYGERHAGKTTLAHIITSLYPFPEKPPEEAGSEYRMSYLLNLTTVPVVYDEPEGISRKPSLLGLIKRAATGDIIRWRGDTNRKYYARGALIITSNHREVLEDPALGERIIQVEFTHSDYVGNKSREEKEAFNQLNNKYETVADHLGSLILNLLVENWNQIREEWIHRLIEKEDYIQLGQWVWHKVAERLGASQPPWATRNIKLVEENPDELVNQTFWDVLHDILVDYARFHRCDRTLMGCVAELGEKGLLPRNLVEWSPSHIVVKAPIKREIERRLNTIIAGSLKNLAEKLGLEYKSVRVGGTPIKGIVIPINTLLKKIGGLDDLVDYLAEVLLFKYNFQNWGREGTKVLPKVLEESRKLGINLDRETAERVVTKLAILSSRRAPDADEYLEEAIA